MGVETTISHDDGEPHLKTDDAKTEGIVVRHYVPQTDEERALDKRVNLKLDCIVLVILSINFIVRGALTLISCARFFHPLTNLTPLLITPQLCGIDKTNVGFTATGTFVKDANLKPNDIPNSLSLFSATYVPLQPLSTLAARKVGPRWWLGGMLLIWGSLCMAHAGIHNSGTLIALRLLLGAAESGFTPTSFYFMSTLYPKYSVGLRMGIFSGAYSLAGAFAGLIAYGLMSIENSTLRGWQIVYLFEGGLTILMALLSWTLLPSDVSTAWFLNRTEREHAVRRMERDLADAQEVAEYDEEGRPIVSPKVNHISIRDVTDVLKDWRKLLTIVFNVLSILVCIPFGCPPAKLGCGLTNILQPVTAFTTFLPLVVQGMGYSGTRASLMSVPPFAAGVVGLVCIVYSSDHFHERSLHTVGGMTLGLIGCIVMATSSNPKVRYGFTHVCLAGIFASGPLVAVWLAGNTPWKSTRSFVLGLNGWSNLAGVIAGQIYKADYAPSYKYPLTVTMILIAIGMVGFLFVRAAYMFENRRRRKIIADWDDARFEDEQRSTERRGDQRLTWIYGY
jgi:MFS family permease